MVTRIAKDAIAPTTIPAIAPPESPPELADAVLVGAVVLWVMVAIEVIVSRTVVLWVRVAMEVIVVRTAVVEEEAVESALDDLEPSIFPLMKTTSTAA
jgi:mannose/fructose/N-acetylgalactosamine-specific phosphotransferase system component IID